MSTSEEKTNEDVVDTMDTTGASTGASSTSTPNNTPNEQTEQTDNCAICRSTLGEGGLSTTPCDHSFHFGCLARSMNTSSRCPICRAELRPPSPVEIIPAIRLTRVRNPLGILSSVGTRLSHVDEDSETSYRRDRYPPRESRSARDARDARDTRQEREERDSREDREDREGLENIQVEINVEDMANDVDLRAEIVSGLLHSSCRRGDTSSTRELLSENPNLLYSRGDMGDLLTHEAVLSESESVLMYIVNDQALDVNLPNSVRMYPLHYAVVSGSLRMVTILVNRGAYIDCANDSRMTPLMLACDADDSEITQFLLDRGASFRTQDGCGNFPIHIAARAKSYSCVTKLVASGSTVNLKNHIHDTPLHISCRLGYHSVSRLLLEEGADPESDNKFDYSPLDEASSNGNTRIRHLLSRYISS